jgi:uncharacterized protein (DUF58 family)
MTMHPRLDDLVELRHQARTLGLASHHLVNSAFSGLYASVFRGAGLDFEEVREYREGDDIRNMDWHVTARTDVPHLKVFQEERERSVIICVDGGPHMGFGTRGTFKAIQAARAVALLGWAANQLNDRVGGLIFGDPIKSLQYFRPHRGRRALWRMLSVLTQPGKTGETLGDPLLEALKKVNLGAQTGALIFVIAAMDRELDTLERTFGSLRQRHAVVLLPVDDPADMEIPSMGRVVFSGPEGRLLEVNTDDEEGQELYRTDWQRRRRKLHDLANRMGFTMIALRTDEDVHRSLMRGLQRRVKMRVLR